MSRVRAVNILSLLLWFIVPWLVHAQKLPSTPTLPPLLSKPELIELKSKLEQAITKNYKDRISTQLDVNLFSVSVQVTLLELPEPKKEEKLQQTNDAAEHSALPADINLGNIQLNPIYEKLKNEIKSNENGKQALSDILLDSWMRHVQITKVDVFIGLDSKIDKEYQKTFSEWLVKVIKSEFGSIGSYKVFEIKKMDLSKEVPTVFEQLSRFQVTLGFIILSSIFLLVVLLSRFTTSRDTKEKNQTAILIQEMQVAQMNAASTAASNAKALIQDNLTKNSKDTSKLIGDENIVAHLPVIAQAFKDLQIKVGFLLEFSALSNSEITESWFAQGWQGRIKFAALLDSILSYESVNKASEFKNVKNLNTSNEILTWIQNQRNTSEKELYEAFQEFPNIPIQDRYRILEQCYWDLLSLKIMGKQVLKSRFTILQDLPNDKIQEVLSTQDQKLKALAILHLPQAKIQILLKGMSNDEKQKLITDSLKMNALNISDVELADETLKFAVNKEKISKENEFSVESLVPNLLSSLSVIDEFKMLPNALLQMKDQGLYIKKNFPSLVFFAEWPDDLLKIFFDQVEPKYIVSYLQMALPMQTRIIKIIAPKTASIVSDELRLAKEQELEELEKNLTFLKTRLYKLINDEVFYLTKIFNIKSTSNVKPKQVA